MTIKTDLENFLSMVEEPAPAPEVPFTIPQPGKVSHKLTFRFGRAKNFRSIGNEFMEIDYQRNAATLVTSDDNGAGKSTLMVWLPFFVLFNDTYSKKEKKAGLVNSTTKKDCVGEIEFFTKGSEWKVRRGIKPDFVEVHQMVDGAWKQLENDAAKADVNKVIETLIGVDQKMMENTLVMGKEKFIPFTEMGAPDRRTMVETIWDLGVFTAMNEDVKAEIKVLNSSLETSAQSLKVLRTELDGKTAQLEQVNASNALLQQQSADSLAQAQEALIVMEQSQAEHQKRNDEATTQVQGLYTEINHITELVDNEIDDEVYELTEEYKPKVKKIEDDLDVKVEDYNRIEIGSAEKQIEISNAEITKVTEKLEGVAQRKLGIADELAKVVSRANQGDQFRVRFNTELEGHNSAIKRFHDMGTCPTCTQVVSDETKGRIEGEYQPKINDIQDKINSLETVQTSLKSEIDSFNTQMAEVEVEATAVQTELNALKEQRTEAEASIRSLKSDISGFRLHASVEITALNNERDTRVADLRRAGTQRVIDRTASIDTRVADLNNELARLTETLRAGRSRIVAQKSTISDLEAKLAQKPIETLELEERIQVLNATITTEEEHEVKLNEEIQDHQHLLFFLRDDQTKARMVALYLPYLNSKVNEYLEAVNMFLNIDIDDKFDIGMAAPERKGQSIFSLSTGQRGRLNLAITLALRDVANLKASVQCNILVLDEILENLSERGVQEAVMMLQHKFKENNLFVISQREQEFQEYFQHSIRYGLRNGMTQVINKE